MIGVDEDALICDLAETYHVLDWRSLPVRLVATLSCGLREDSRIKLKMSGQKLSLDNTLRAMQVDALNLLLWTKTKDAQNGRNQPESVYSLLVDEDVKHENKHSQKIESMVFGSPEEFAEALRKNRERREADGKN